MAAALYEYALLIAALAILSALLEFMIPGGKLKQTVMLVIGLLFLLGIAAPLMSLLNGGDFPSLGEQQDISAPLAESGQLTHEELLQRYYQKYIEE